MKYYKHKIRNAYYKIDDECKWWRYEKEWHVYVWRPMKPPTPNVVSKFLKPITEQETFIAIL